MKSLGTLMLLFAAQPALPPGPAQPPQKPGTAYENQPPKAPAAEQPAKNQAPTPQHAETKVRGMPSQYGTSQRVSAPMSACPPSGCPPTVSGPVACPPLAGGYPPTVFAGTRFLRRPLDGGHLSQHIAEDEPPAVRKRIRAEKHLSPGDMYPRMPYFPVCHGYYYFRPYNFRHISKHQQIALRWGNDPRMPYSNRLFDDLYRNLGVAAVEELPEPAAARRPQEPADFFQPLEDY